jgi:glyoxylase-like metal-dependent hydrolase (beta-lactamase superfamily II)
MASSFPPAPPSAFELYALRYAHHAGRSMPDNFIGGDPHESASPLDYYIWVARRSDRVFVIDTGFGPEAAKVRARELLRLPGEALNLIGIDPAQVEDVIITHMHYDHAGSFDAFSKARFHVQDAESAYATGRFMCHEHLRRPYDTENVVSFVRHLYQGRVAFHDGVSELDPGLTLHRIGGHSPGLQAVRVWTKRGWVVIASDGAHLYANLQRRLAFPIVHDVGAMLEGFGHIQELGGSIERIVPGHDPLVMAIYPPLASGLEGVAARLDLEPKPLA